MNEELEIIQRAICVKYEADFFSCPLELKVGISKKAMEGAQPLHGMRIWPEGDTCGWYIWAGEFSEDPGFFVPLHVAHLAEWVPLVLPYLALPPGRRFLVAEGYEDVWADSQILE
jgi:hypothetical protein